MTQELHDQFMAHVKTMRTYEGMFKKMGDEIAALRAFLVQQENDAVSLEKQNKKAKAELEETKRMIQEKRIMGDANLKNIQDRLDKRHLELVEREAKVRISEQAADEQLRKANSLLAAAESTSKPRRQTAAA